MILVMDVPVAAVEARRALEAEARVDATGTGGAACAFSPALEEELVDPMETGRFETMDFLATGAGTGREKGAVAGIGAGDGSAAWRRLP